MVQEEVQKWRELNCAADFVELAAAINPLVQSLPQVLHHQVTKPCSCRAIESPT